MLTIASMDGGLKIATGVRRKLGTAVPGVIVLAIVLLVQLLGVPGIDRLGYLLFDQYQRAQPRLYQDADVRIVDIDDATIAKLGQWPWPRTDIALLTQRLANAGAAAVVYDVVFSEPDRTSPARLAARMKAEQAPAEIVAALETLPDNDQLLAETLGQARTVLAFFLDDEGKGATVQPKVEAALGGDPPNNWRRSFTHATAPLPVLGNAATGLGFVSRVGDADGIVRTAPLVYSQNGQLVPALSVEALRVAQGATAWYVKSTTASGELGGKDRVGIASFRVGDIEVPTTDQGELWMYYTAPHPERTTAAWKILTGALDDDAMQKAFQGKIVFIGTGATGLRDIVSTPIQSRELGVMVHAQATEQMILKQFLSRPYWAEAVERTTLLFAGLLLALLLPWMGAARGLVLGVLLVGAMMLGSWFAFSNEQMLLNPVYPALGLVLIYLIETAYSFWREERQRAYIHQAFDRYLSPDLVQRIVDDPSRLELGGEEREMTVLFCDIRQFSRTSEKLSPQEIIRFLIAFLTPMCDILLARKATIDKFIGDAVLAFWNAPLDDPDQYGNAARGALEMIERLKQLNRTMPGGAEPWPGEVNIGIGMNAGPCCVGNMGSAQRLSYSLIGDTVNLASRIEGLTKYYGVSIAIGEELQARLREFATVELDKVRVVGRDAPETLHALLGDELLAADPAYQIFAANHEAMRGAYRAQDWDGAEKALAANEGAAPAYGLTKLYALMRERIGEYRETPPGADWDGVYQATEK